MAYLALYRKFRPNSFEEVKGQDAVVTTLKNQMIHDRLGHAYLFCGTRGTGKTSVAKLLAKAVNCENPQEGSPCGECESCRRIARGAAMNVIEIDAASNNGVDNIRQINEGVQYAPADGRMLVYIIDEVHMLSSGAFNALLKTLEEPPSYVLFILATTEFYKVPVTIRSRCQHFEFHRIPYSVISDRMEEILRIEAEAEPGGENPGADREALDFIARAADGSMRDALSLLDQCISYNLGRRLTLELALSAIGAVDTDLFLRLEQGIAEDDPVGVMNLISDVVWRGTELTRFTEDFSMFLRNVLFLKLSPELAKQLDMTADTVEKMKKLGESLTEDTLFRQIRVLQEVLQELKISTLKRITLEMGIIRLMRPESETDLTGVLSRLDRLELRADRSEEAADTVKQMTEEMAGISETLNELKSRPVTMVSSGEMAKVQGPGAGQITDAKVSEEEAAEILKKSCPPATAEEIMTLAREWNKKVIPGLRNPHKIFMQSLRIMPDRNQDGETIGLILYTRKNSQAPADSYYSNEKDHDGNLRELEEQITAIAERKVRIRVVDGDGPEETVEIPGLSRICFGNIEFR